jgi:hypothetical protein
VQPDPGHTYLYEVDQAFEPEGVAGRYSRWVDDIVIGAPSREEGLQYVKRAQLALEKMGLSPNPTKTRVVSRAEFDKGLFS